MALLKSSGTHRKWHPGPNRQLVVPRRGMMKTKWSAQRTLQNFTGARWNAPRDRSSRGITSYQLRVTSYQLRVTNAGGCLADRFGVNRRTNGLTMPSYGTAQEQWHPSSKIGGCPEFPLVGRVAPRYGKVYPKPQLPPTDYAEWSFAQLGQARFESGAPSAYAQRDSAYEETESWSASRSPVTLPSPEGESGWPRSFGPGGDDDLRSTSCPRIIASPTSTGGGPPAVTPLGLLVFVIIVPG